MHSVCFTLQKDGNDSHENEDKNHIRSLADDTVSYFALSDGATESAFSSEWALELVESDWEEILSESSEAEQDWLLARQERFKSRVDVLPLPWYAKTKIDREGSFATFLGVRLQQIDDGTGRWDVVACGDTCFFYIASASRRRKKLSFPIEEVTDFGNRPRLVSSKRSADESEPMQRKRGVWKTGDKVILATDAVALWLLKPSSNHLSKLLKCQDEEAFRHLIEQERTCSRMKNDDSTAIIIYL